MLPSWLHSVSSPQISMLPIATIWTPKGISSSTGLITS